MSASPPRPALAAVLALVAALPASAAAVPARVVASVEVGAGGSSAAAGEGAADAFTDVAPAVRLDVALAPAWKLALAADAAWVHYLRSEQDVLTQSGELGLRFVGVDRLELAAAVGGEHEDFGAQGGALEPPLVLAPTVTSTAAARLDLEARWRPGAAIVPFAGATGALRTSTVPGGAGSSSREGALALGVRAGVGGGAFVTALYRLVGTGSDAQEFASTSHALLAAIDVPLGPVRAGAGLQLRTVSFATGDGEDLARPVLGVAWPLSEAFELSATYAVAFSSVSGPDATSTTRHLGALTLRWRAPELRL